MITEQSARVAVATALCLLAAGCGAGVSRNDAPPLTSGQAPRPGDSWRSPSTGMVYRYIPLGELEMGSRYAYGLTPEAHPEWYQDESPPHHVTIARGFWLGETEVTVAQFRAFVEATAYLTSAEVRGASTGPSSAPKAEAGPWGTVNGLSWKNPGFPTTDDMPVVHVSWRDARAYCDWLDVVDPNARYRLPTEAEWEYVASSGQGWLYPWGDTPPTTDRPAVANIGDESFRRAFPAWKYPVLDGYDDGYAGPAPVGTYAPNRWGLADLGGNVWEWVADYYQADFYASSPASDPQGPQVPVPDERFPGQAPTRVHKGGGFDWELPFLRVAKRRRLPEDASVVHLGFRVVRVTNLDVYQ